VARDWEYVLHTEELHYLNKKTNISRAVQIKEDDKGSVAVSMMEGVVACGEIERNAQRTLVENLLQGTYCNSICGTKTRLAVCYI
jgi:hypothetical protein